MKSLDLKITKETLKLALPVMLTQVGQVSVNLFDNIIVGKLLGAKALASVSLANSLFFSVFVFGLGFSFAIPPLVSEAHSQNNHEKINSVIRHGFVVNLLVGIFLVALIFGLIPLLPHMGQPKEILPDTITFLSIITISIIPFMIFQTMREVSEGLSFTIGVTKATIFANIINVILNYFFIKNFSWGVAGSAWATFIARICMLMFLYFVLRNDKKTKQYIIDFSLKIKSFQKEMFRTLIKLGFPTALQMFFEVTAFAGAAFICGLISAKDIAAHQIALSMASFTFNLCIGFSVASTIMIGRKLGEKDFVNLEKTGFNNLKIAFIFMLMCGIFLVLGRNTLPSFFTKKEDLEVMLLASKLMFIAALFQLSDGVQVTALGCLRGIQDVKIPSIITFVSYWVITIPLGYYLTVSEKMGAFGMWIALGIGLTISALSLVLRFKRLADLRIK